MMRFGLLLQLALFSTQISSAGVSFKPVPSVDVSAAPTSAAVADLNGDGKPDLAVALGFGGTNNQGSIAILLGNGDGSFTFLSQIDSGGGFPTAVALADFNNDGKADLVVVNCELAEVFTSCPDEKSNGVVAVFLGNGNGTFQAVQTYDTGGGGAIKVVVADLNRDGKLDLVVGNECAAKTCTTVGGVGLLLGNGNGTFQPVSTYQGVGQGRVAVADLNQDGKVDLVLDIGSSINVMLGNGNGSFQTPVAYMLGGVSSSVIAIKDVNRDGKPDIIAVNNGVTNAGMVRVLIGHGDATFQSAVTYPSSGVLTLSMSATDVNGDSDPDVIVTSCAVKGSSCFVTGTGAVTILQGKGNGKFQTAIPFSSGGAYPNALAIADLNGDGRPDLIATNFFSNNLGVLLNDGAFATSTVLTSSLNPSIYGQAVTLSATVTSKGSVAPTGTVTFKNGTSSIGTVSLNGNTAALTKRYLPAGTLSLTATYNGDTQSGKSTSSPVKQVISQATSTTAIKSSPNPSLLGQSVTLTATVLSPTASGVSGAVTFTAGSTILGTVSLSSRKASFTASTLPQGNLTITATYNGTSNIVGSSASLIQSVR